jgi:hypothetical protein
VKSSGRWRCRERSAARGGGRGSDFRPGLGARVAGRDVGLAREERRARRLESACTPEVVALGGAASSAAQRVAGRGLRASERAEWIEAEVASALPIDADLARAGESAPGRRALRSAESSCDARSNLGSFGPAPNLAALDLPLPPLALPWLAPEVAARGAHSPAEPADLDRVSDAPRAAPDFGIPPLASVYAWLAGVERADPFERARRLILALAFEQRLAAELGPRLAFALRRGQHLALGYRQREADQRERLGLDRCEWH